MIHEKKNKLDGWQLMEDFNLQKNLVTIYYYRWHDEFVLIEKLLLIINDMNDIIGCLVREDF